MYRIILAKKDNIPVSIYNKLYRQNDEIIKTYLALSKVSREELLLKMAKSESTQPMILMNLADSTFESVKLSTAQHPNTPNIVLKKLSFDGEKDIRRAAKDALFIREQTEQFQTNDNDIEGR